MRAIHSSIRLYLVLLCSGWAALSLAQPLTELPYETKLKTANELVEKNDFYNALDYFEQCYDDRKDPKIAVRIADMHLMLRDFARAEKAYKRVVDRDKEFEYPDALFNYGRVLKMNGKYEEAWDALNRFVEQSDPTIDQVKLAKAEMEGIKLAASGKDIKRLVVESAGDNINTKSTEYSPMLDQGGVLYFAAQPAKEPIVLDNKAEGYHSRIFTATRDAEGKFGKGTALADIINREGFHTGNPVFTPDGMRMYFTRSKLDGNIVKESQIYVSKKDKEGWAPAEMVQGLGEEYINKQPATGELFGKSVLFFVSNIPGGSGGSDLYYATIEDDFRVSNPTNLGPVVNTIGNEETPFYIDGKLFFSSTGHPGLGGYDIFVSSWNGSTWSKPENVGKGLNTSLDEFYFSTDKMMTKGLMVSNREGTKSFKSKTCCDDIFSWRIDEMRVRLLATVISKTGPLKGAKVVLEEMTNDIAGNPVDKMLQDTNLYEFKLNTDKFYRVIVSKEGYFPDTVSFKTVGVTDSKDYKAKVTLQKIPEPEYETVTINQPIRLNNIYYDYNDDKILLASEPDLTKLLGLMNQYKDMVIELSSHTDARGDDAYNKELSQRRANSAKKWLVAKGVADARIKAVGYGEEKLQNKCLNDVECTDDEHRVNRRTEFKIIAGPTSIQIEKEVKRGTKLTDLKEEDIVSPKQKITPSQEENQEETKPAAEKKAPQKESKPAPKKETKPVAKPETPATPPPAPAPQPEPVKQGPEITFAKKTVNFGKLKKGAKPKRELLFTNTGNQDLVVELVSGCDCTTLDWTREPVKPGQQGKITIIYDSSEKKTGKDDVTLDIVTNTEPNIHQIKLNVEIIK